MDHIERSALQHNCNAIISTTGGTEEVSVSFRSDVKEPTVFRAPGKGPNLVIPNDCDPEVALAESYRVALRYGEGSGFDRAGVTYQKDETLKAFAKVSEKHRLEVLGGDKYEGVRGAFSHDVVRACKALTPLAKNPQSREQAAIVAAGVAGLAGRATWSTKAHDAFAKLVSACSPPVMDGLEKITNAGLHDFKLSGPEQAWEHAIKLKKLLLDENPNESDPNSQENGDGEGDGKGDGKGESRGGKKPTSGNKDKGDENNEGEKGEQAASKALGGPADAEEPDPNGDYAHPDVYGGGYGYSPIPVHQQGVIDMGRGTYKPAPGETQPLLSHLNSSHRNRTNPTKLEGAARLGNQVRQYIQSRSAAEWERGLKHGHIDRSALHRLCVDRVGTGDWNRSVFKRKIESDTLDTCVQLVLDDSGSMDGEKAGIAMSTGVLLADVMGNQLHIKTSVTLFSDWHMPVNIVAKDWDERLSNEEMSKRMKQAYNLMGNNSDGDNLLWNYHRVAQRPEKRKLMIVVSDGYPASSRPGNIGTFTQEVIDLIYAKKRVELYGIGVGDDCRSAGMYKKHVFVPVVTALPDVILKLVRDYVAPAKHRA